MWYISSKHGIFDQINVINMATKKKKAKRGGARPGAGPKFTGVNTVYLRSCVHKAFAEEAKALVKAAYTEWKAKQAGKAPVEAVLVMSKDYKDKLEEALKEKIPAAKPVEAKKQTSNEAPTRKPGENALDWAARKSAWKKKQ